MDRTVFDCKKPNSHPDEMHHIVAAASIFYMAVLRIAARLSARSLAALCDDARNTTEGRDFSKKDRTCDESGDEQKVIAK